MKREELIFWFGMSFEKLHADVQAKKFTGQIAELAVPVGLHKPWSTALLPQPAFVTYDTVNKQWLHLKWGDTSIDLRDFWA
jgi:hypothetical protein